MIIIKDDVLVYEDGKKKYEIGIGTPEAFRIISKLWLRSGWDTKHVYTFTWLGRPIIQLPEDLLRIQEVIYTLKPDVIIETGVAHGGSLIFYANICKAINIGRIIGVDIEIRKHNRIAIESHELASYINLIEGSSIDGEVIVSIRNQIKPDEKVIVILDSKHTKEHVLCELKAYSEFVSVGSYIVATDGIMKDLVGAPRSDVDWAANNPYDAANEFVRTNDKFIIEQPTWLFNESNGLAENVTYWPGAWLKKVKG